MPIKYGCPFFVSDKPGEKWLKCEIATFSFPDKLSRREIVYQYCANDKYGYHACPMYAALMHYYDRKEKAEP